ncbi:MAG: FAD-dependent oxidoreductase [Thalassobius sp.]|nr:FAD-dependent oxidoreductase [Thalassovita sp.]
MRLMRRVLGLIFFIGYIYSVSAQEKTDILIIGGGAGGTSAAIQAARMGTKVTVIERTPWLGGMLTSAGVSAIDGNHQMPSGFWGEFRQKLYDYYGGASALSTGWVSHTLFEPSVANNILKELANIPNLTIHYNANYSTIKQENGLWQVTYNLDGKAQTVTANILIDATETGELLPIVGADYRLGMDARAETGETEAPEKANSIIQDLTYVAILKDVGDVKSKKGLVKKPKDYDSKNYECACDLKGDAMFNSVSECSKMLSYGKLPNNKYMINWPNCGNDFYFEWEGLSPAELDAKVQEAKNFTLGFVYYIQNELGFKNLRLENEFATKDALPFIPYHREGRRVKGKVFLTANHLEAPYKYNLSKTGVAVGDYPIDHHHAKKPDAPKIEFIHIRVPSYNIPLGSLIPEKIENFLVAEKNISVSNIVNGTSRLQPVVLGVGQASGAIAATAIKKQVPTSQVSIREVQNALLDYKAYIMPLIDVSASDKAFASMQRIAATHILKAEGVPYKWANETWFYPERIVSEYELKTGLLAYYPELENIPVSGKGITFPFIASILKQLYTEIKEQRIKAAWKNWNIDQEYSSTTALNRRTVSIIIDQILNPFALEVDFQGDLVKE